MKKLVVIVSCLIMLFTVAPSSFAAVDSKNESSITSEEEALAVKMINSNQKTMIDGNLRIERVDESLIENNVVGIAGFEESDIEYANFYTIEEINKSSNGESHCTLVSDIKLSDSTIANLSEGNTRASGGSDWNQDDAGRVVAYVKATYETKTFNGVSCRKMTKIQGKLVSKPASVTVRKVRLQYRSFGAYYTSGGTRYTDDSYHTSSKSFTSNFTTLKTYDTSAKNRYYMTSGNSVLQARCYITYGPENNLVEPHVYINIVEF